MTDIRHSTGLRLNIKRPPGANANPSKMDPSSFSLRDDRQYDVPGLKSFCLLLSHQAAPRKSKRVQIGALIRTPAESFNSENRNVPMLNPGVFPVQAASNAWVLGTLRRQRLNLVLPPVDTSTGRPVLKSSFNIVVLVAFTAAVSVRGPLTLACDAF